MTPLSQTSNAFARSSFGQNGHAFVTNTTQATGPFEAIVCVDETVIETLVVTSRLTGSYDGVTLPAGHVLYGVFASIKLTSGRVQAYYANHQ